MEINPTWIAADWGTSCLRVWAMSDKNQILAQCSNEKGMGQLKASEYEATLLGLISAWLPTNKVTPVLICGMAGAKQGWQEAPYLATPIQLPQQLTVTRVKTLDARITVFILPGLKQLQPADVMRGEETQLVGFLQQQPDFAGIAILPGTHTKWVAVAKQTIQQFHTVMTGELFQLLRQQSLLRYTIQQGEWQAEAFAATLLQALQHPNGFGQRLFALRADGLLHNQSPEVAYAKLSAELIALEITAMQHILLNDPKIPLAIIGNQHLNALYQQALQLAGYQANTYSGEQLNLMGLSAAFQTLSLQEHP